MDKNKCTSTRWQGRHSQQQFPLVDNTLGLWRIVRGKWSVVDRGIDFGSWYGKSDGRNNEVMGWNEGLGSLNGLILKKTPAGSGRVRLINHAMVPQRRSIAYVTNRRWFRHVCPSLKIIERRTWYDGGIRPSVAAEKVRRCMRQWLLQSNFLQNFLVMCLQI